jgi:Helix-turn-helix domain
MSSKPPHSSPGPAKCDEMLTPEEFAKVLKVSLSWLAKARKRGDGPPFFRAGRSVRYFPLRKPE